MFQNDAEGKELKGSKRGEKESGPTAAARDKGNFKSIFR